VLEGIAEEDCLVRREESSGWRYPERRTRRKRCRSWQALPVPPGSQVINDRCLLRSDNGRRIVIVSGIVLAHYAVGDRIAEAHARVTLVEQGWADQNDVARVFGCSARTVRRDQHRFEDGGMAALGQADGYPKGRLRVTLARSVERAQKRRALQPRDRAGTCTDFSDSGD
jgi:hypothetical protein